MEIEPKPVITLVSDASLTLETVLGREMVPACRCQPFREKILQVALSQEHKLAWPPLTQWDRINRNIHPSSKKHPLVIHCF